MGTNETRKSISNRLKKIIFGAQHKQPYHIQQGHYIEQQACHYLTQQGLRLKQHHFQCKYGEIDLIMQQQQMLIFVEVRYRRHTNFGLAYETIHAKKQRCLIQTAQYYLQSHPHPGPCRFDIMSYSGNMPPHWIKNAFDS